MLYDLGRDTRPMKGNSSMRFRTPLSPSLYPILSVLAVLLSLHGTVAAQTLAGDREWTGNFAIDPGFE
jgi:hypothetical protein